MATLTWNPGINSYSPYVKLYVTQKSQSISGNYTILEYSLKLYRPRQIYSSASKSYNIKINGTTVKSGSTTIGGSGTKTIASGTTKVYHNSNGTKKNVAISFYQEVSITWSGVATGNASKSGTMDLTTIPRYAKITSLYANNIRGTQFKINYATDKTIDNVDYSLNGGSWQDTHNSSSYFYITGLKPGTRYTVKIRVRSKDSGLWTTSGTITITTVGLSTSNEPDFDTDGNLTINISRKSTSMYHDLYLYFWHDEQRWEEIARISNVTTKGIFNFTSNQLNEIYNGRVQSNKSNTRLKIVSKWGSNGTVQGTTYEYGELTIVNANPSIDGVTYKDTDTDVQAILNNDQLILRNKSYLEVTAGTASSQKGATLKSYKLSIGGNEYSIATSGTSETGKKIYWGPLDQSSNQTAVLTVIDSRGNKASRSFTIQVINYYEPEPVNYSADRLNNYEESSYINAELRRSVVNINGNDINELYIRYSVSSGSTTSAKGNNSYKNGTWQHVDVNEFIGDYPNDKSYLVFLEIKDKFSNWLTITMDLPEGIALLSFLKDKIKAGVPFENLAIGKNHEGKATLEVGGTVDSLGYKGPIVPERIPSGADLNDYQDPGMYYCPMSADARNISNTPQNVAFSLLVERHAGYKQTFTVYYNNTDIIDMYIRNIYSGTWSNWVKVSLGTSTSDIITDSDSAYRGLMAKGGINSGGNTYIRTPQSGLLPYSSGGGSGSSSIGSGSWPFYRAYMEYLYLPDSSTRLSKGTDNSLRISTASGIVDIGNRNSSYTHLSTNGANGFYFYQAINVADFRSRGYSSLANGNFAVYTSGGYNIIVDDNAGKYSEICIRPSADNHGNIGSYEYSWDFASCLSWSGGSSREKKNSIEKYDETLAYEQLKDIPIYTFAYNNEENNFNRHLGTMVDYMPIEMTESNVSLGENGEVRMFDLANSLFFNMAASKVMQQKIEKLQEENEDMKLRLDALEGK